MSPNPESILDSVKKTLGLDDTVTAFDLDLTLLINGAMGNLHQVGVGGDTGFVIADNTMLWSQYVTSLTYLNQVKQYIFTWVKLAFDPPGTSFVIAAFEKQAEELLWRIGVAVEAENPPSDPFTGITIPTTPTGPTLNPAHDYYWWDITTEGDFIPPANVGDIGFNTIDWNIWSLDLLNTQYAELWDLTGLSDFPSEAAIGDMGIDTVSGDMWRNEA